MILCVTGHRPNKLGGYDDVTYKRLVYLAAESLIELGPNLVYTGMALGWDQAIAEACITLKIDVIGAIPCFGQEKIWPEAAQAKYHKIVSKLKSYKYITKDNYHHGCMQARNKWMVYNSGRVLALWDGSGGGTADCIKWANIYEVPVHNVWSKWVNEYSKLEV